MDKEKVENFFIKLFGVLIFVIPIIFLVIALNLTRYLNQINDHIGTVLEQETGVDIINSLLIENDPYFYAANEKFTTQLQSLVDTFGVAKNKYTRGVYDFGFIDITNDGKDELFVIYNELNSYLLSNKSLAIYSVADEKNYPLSQLYLGENILNYNDISYGALYVYATQSATYITGEINQYSDNYNPFMLIYKDGKFTISTDEIENLSLIAADNFNTNKLILSFEHDYLDYIVNKLAGFDIYEKSHEKFNENSNQNTTAFDGYRMFVLDMLAKYGLADNGHNPKGIYDVKLTDISGDGIDELFVTYNPYQVDNSPVMFSVYTFANGEVIELWNQSYSQYEPRAIKVYSTTKNGYIISSTDTIGFNYEGNLVKDNYDFTSTNTNNSSINSNNSSNTSSNNIVGNIEILDEHFNSNSNYNNNLSTTPEQVSTKSFDFMNVFYDVTNVTTVHFSHYNNNYYSNNIIETMNIYY